MIKDTFKENALGIFQSLAGVRTADLPTPEPIEQPEAAKVVVGVFLLLFAQILCVRFVSFSDVLVLIFTSMPDLITLLPRSVLSRGM